MKNHVINQQILYQRQFWFYCQKKNTSIQPDHILVSYDVSALLTNVPLKETIDILVDKSFEDDWFN